MDFAARHIGPSPAEQQRMLAATGLRLARRADRRRAAPGPADPPRLDLPPALTEAEALAELRRLAARNQVLTR